MMLKSTAGGGDWHARLPRRPRTERGVCHGAAAGANNFNDAGVFLEKYIERAAISSAIFGDRKGAVIALGVRDCSLQRRNQSSEETPAPNLPDGMAQALCSAQLPLGKR